MVGKGLSLILLCTVPTCADDGPRCSIVDHLLVGLRGARCGLELDNPVLRETQVHTLRVLHVEGNLEWSVGKTCGESGGPGLKYVASNASHMQCHKMPSLSVQPIVKVKLKMTSLAVHLKPSCKCLHYLYTLKSNSKKSLH